MFDDTDKRVDVGNATDKFFKMRFFFDKFRSKISSAFEPCKYVCVDEDLYSFRRVFFQAIRLSCLLSIQSLD